jgi:hypothetical protein
VDFRHKYNCISSHPIPSAPSFSHVDLRAAVFIMAESRMVADHELLGDKLQVTHSEVMHFGQLTEEELVIEKKLRRKIDSLIMPLVILVYLMNYIDRSVQHLFIGNYKLID